VDVIRHDHEGVEGDRSEVDGNLEPALLDNSPQRVGLHLIALDYAKKAGAVTQTDRYEVRASGGVVVLT
jgi:hypothetical protein